MQTPTITRPLTGDELAGVIAAIDAADAPAGALLAALRATFDALLGDAGLSFDHFSADDPVDGRCLSIPRPQWLTIAAYLQKRAGGGLGQVNLAMDWMNLGPSAYVET